MTEILQIPGMTPSLFSSSLFIKHLLSQLNRLISSHWRPAASNLTSQILSFNPHNSPIKEERCLTPSSDEGEAQTEPGFQRQKQIWNEIWVQEAERAALPECHPLSSRPRGRWQNGFQVSAMQVEMAGSLLEGKLPRSIKSLKSSPTLSILLHHRPNLFLHWKYLLL